MKSINYFPYAGRIVFKGGAMPQQLIFFITNRCNLRCKHCFYWESINKRYNELNLDEIKKISKSFRKLLSLYLTGGEPFLRDDIPDIVNTFYKNNKVRHIVIPTNGVLKSKILKSLERILRFCKDAHVLVYISLDGIGKHHDNIRGLKGCYNKAIDTFKSLKLLKNKYKNLNISFLITFSTLNQDYIIEDYYYMKKNLKPDNIYLNLVRGDPKEPILKNINFDIYTRLVNLISNDLIKKNLAGHDKSFFHELTTAINLETHAVIKEVVKQKKFQIPCYAGTLNAVLYPNGDVFPCEILNKKIGNIRDFGYDFKKLWFSNQAKLIREYIKKSKCFCTHECFINNNLLFNYRIFPKLLTKSLILKLKKK